MISSELEAIIRPAVKAMGFDLWACELTGSKGNHVLHVYIDSPKGVTIDDCVAVSRQVSAVLDVEDPISGAYNLEVSSPGIDRQLFTLAHYETVVGKHVSIELHHAQVDGRKRFKGKLSAVIDDTIEVEIDGDTYTLPYEDVAKAKVVGSIK